MMNNPNSLMVEDYALALESQLDQTIKRLEEKAKLLADQVDEIKTLQKQIEGGKKGQSFIIALGGGYFTEKPKEQALEFLNGKLTNLEFAKISFEGKINQALTTKKNFNKLQQFSNETLQSTGDNTSLNEEGLPFMEIEEELDDNGNVLRAKINNQEHVPKIDSSIKSSRAKNVNDTNISKSYSSQSFGKGSNKIDFIQEEINDDDESGAANQTKSIYSQAEDNEQVTELLKDMEVFVGLSNVENELEYHNDLLNKIRNLKISPDDKLKLKQICLEEYEKTINGENPTDKTTELRRSFDQVEETEGEQVVSETVKENEFNMASGFEDLTSTSTPKANEVAINQNDILELELLADDLNEYDAYDESEKLSAKFADDEEWDFEFSEDEDEASEDDIGDELLYGTDKSFLVGNNNKKMNAMLWDQIMDLRLAKADLTSPSNQIDENIDETKTIRKNNIKTNDKKKSVRFAKHLDIKEIENISEYIKQPQHTAKLSLFKQGRISNGKHISNENNSHSVNDKPISDLIIESHDSLLIQNDKLFDNFNPRNSKKIDIPVSDKIVEPLDRYNLVEQSIKENEGKLDVQPKKVSKFKSAILQKHKIESPSVSPLPFTDNSTSGAPITSDIVEREISSINLDLTNRIQSEQSIEHSTASIDVEKSRRVSRFKKRLSVNAKKEIPEMEHEVNSQDDLDVSGITEDNEDLKVKEAIIDFQNLQNDMDTMAKAYVLGMYDEDIETEGPVVNQLEDFEVLNRMLDSMPSKENHHHSIQKLNIDSKNSESFDPELDVLELQDFDENEENENIHNYNEDEEDEDEDGEDSGPILADQIIENDFENSTDDFASFLDASMDLEIMNQEIVNNYHRLRQKIIFENNKTGFRKSEAEQEFEPIDEDGNPIRISRFKAARMRQ